MSRAEHAVRLLRIAEDDLAEIVEYVASDRPSAGETLLGQLEKGLGLLAAHPFLGRVPKEEELASMGYRYLVVEEYLVFYAIEGKTILVHRVLHGARDYLSLF